MPFPPYPSVPAPSTWTAGELVTAPQLRADVANAVAFLANRPYFVGQNTLGPSVPNATATPVTMNVNVVDNWAGSVPTTSLGTLYYAQVPGWYLVEAIIPWNFNRTTPANFLAGLSGLSGGSSYQFNGPVQWYGAGGDPTTVLGDLVLLSNTGTPGGSGDNIGISAYQNSGGTLTLRTVAPVVPYMLLRWVAATAGTTGLPVPSNPAYPVPPAALGHAFMNANVRDAIRFLTYPPVMKGCYTAGTATLPATAFPAGTAIACNTITVDNYSGYSVTTGAYTAPVAGVYYCYFQLSLAPNSSGITNLAAGFRVNAGTIAWGASVYYPVAANGGGISCRKRLRLNAGDTVTPYASQDSSGGAIPWSTVAADQSRFIVVWESA